MGGLKSTCSREDFWLVHVVLLVTVCAQVVNAGGTWGQWREWSGCSQTCGIGDRMRTRVCTGDTSCSIEIKGKTDFDSCKVEDCPLKECGGTITDDTGSIQSPNYPDNYPAGANCTWKLVAPSGYYFKLKVITFSLESSPDCGRDSISIEGVYANGLVSCGHGLPDTLTSTSNELSIHFVSDYQTGEKGFDFEYTRKVIPKCNGEDNFCYNGGTCSGINECDCKLGFIGYRCSYIGYDKTTNDAEPSGEFHFPSKVCSMYGSDHVETFENHKYQLSRACQYIMAKFGNTEEILVRRDIDCPSTRSCLKKVEITSGTSNVVKITRDGVVNFDGENITLPVSKYGFGISQTKWHIFVMFNDWKLTIDKKDFSLFLTATSETASQAKGLCSIARFKTNGLASVSSMGLLLITREWEQNDVGESCTSDDTTTSPCPDDQTDQESVCNVLYTEAFDECRLNISVDSYYNQCLSDLCQCSIEETDDCHCSVVSKYARDCARAGFAIGQWRITTSCERTCPGNKVFLECAKSCPATCENTGFGHCNEECTDGCHCAEGKYWDGSWCVSKDECPCSHAGRKFQPRVTVIEGCKRRVCLGSIWNYTEIDCPATASAVGFSHFQTFDGSWFDFPASNCEYLFVEDKSEAKSFSIYVTAEPCGSHQSKFSCIRKVKVIESMSSHSYYVTLLPNGEALSQNNILAALPTTNGGITVRRITSIYIEAVIPDLGVSVLWNGRTSLHVTVPKSFTEKLHGLGGNYNSKTVDDLTAKSGAVSAPVVFGNSWKQPAECPDVDSTNISPQACLINQHLAESAKEQCDILKGPLFATCRNYVPYDTYYTNCKEDVCACEAGSDCLCDAVAVYAYECIKVGVEVNWRSNDFCDEPCSGGQSFQTNGTLCSKTCRSRMEKDTRCLSKHGVEGCSCPEGMYLSKDGSCVKLEDCPCYVNQEWITPGHVSHPGGGITCTCSNGVHMCNKISSSTKKEQKTCPAGMARRNCTVAGNNHQCTPTCNYLNQTCPQTTCTPECICENGLVRHNDQCIEASACPCVLGGMEYKVGHIEVDGCKTLTCQENLHWHINETNCYDECKVVAGTFYTTFDDKHYQFNGFCEYILATDDCGTQQPSTTSGNFMYHITVKSQDCPGSNRAMCETTVHIIVGALEITLRTGQKPVSSDITFRKFGDLKLVNTSNTFIKTHGNYIIVKTSNGLQIDWDQKTTVYVRMDRSLREKYPPCGMCGNNDGDSSNDFRKMNNDITTSPAQFGNSWKLSSHCADALEISETCHRGRTWAEQQCQVINTAFKHCHAKVDPRYYYNKCVEATCTCDVVGDCECFCSSVADYAYACGRHNIEADWRTPSLCPIMCPNNNTDDACLWRYKACSTCYETCCQSEFNPKLCIDGCYEGCYPNCKSGTVFDENTNTCVVKQSCSPPCVLPVTPPPPPVCNKTNEERVCGWSPWKNTNKPSSASNGEFENIKNLKKLEGMCSSPVEVECKSVNSATAERQTVTCDTTYGLVCYNKQNPSKCDDYEVRFSCCQCVTTCNETCSPVPICESHEELENITSSDDCCPTYSCKCVGCFYDGQLKSPGEEWTENCETMRCSDNGKGCYNITTVNRVECSNVDCPYFAKNVPTPGSMFGKSVEECCSTNCTCRDEYQPGSGARLNCTYPEVLNVTQVTHELLTCEISTCSCPHSDMETTHCVNETSCSPAGCHAESTNRCGCAISSTCVCNPVDCPEPKNCSGCYELVSRPAGSAGSPDTRCETDTCCSTYTCEPIQCNNTEAVECGAKEIRTKVESNSSCCEAFECKCIYCVDDFGNKREVGEEWSSHNDSSCVTMGCMRSSGSYCPVMKVVEDKRLACPVTDITCSKYETKVEEKNGTCCTQAKCYCNESACPTGATECPNGKLIVDEEQSDDRCCDVKKCCLDTCIDEGTHKSGEVWTKDMCHAKRCDCTCDSCNVTELPLYDCSSQTTSSCVSDLSPILRENSTVPCCPISECPCQCEVFGDPHYFTFDHTHYEFAGECQYTLVTYRDSDRLHIYSDNQNCSSEGGVYSVCLKRIYVKWEDTLVALYYEPGMTPEEAVTVNGSSISTLPWYVTGMHIVLSSGKLQLSITEIKLSLEFALEKVPSTKITVPMSTMFNETVGLCGTCSNNKEDDFESRGNTFTSSVDEFASSWLVKETKENCVCATPECKTCSDPNYQSPTCNCSSECEVLRSKLFETCNALIDPTNWLNACETDARGLDECNICKSSAVESYANSCLERGICVDWRGATGCSTQQCSEGFEYKACRSPCEVEQTCEHYRDGATCESDHFVSGCFCKEGLIRKTAGSSECVRPVWGSCPKDPICLTNQILQVEPGDEASCCPQKTCVCMYEVNPHHCKSPFMLEFTNNSCPICICPECSSPSSLPNCTQKLGCRLNVTKQDECGCPESGICECNPDLCPAMECGKCLVAVAVERNTSSEMDECTNCCTPWECRPVTCSPDYNTLLVPEGYKKKQDNDDCCPTIYCASCHLADGSYKEVGSSWFETIDGCSIEYFCSNQTKVDECYNETVINDPRRHCKTREQYQSECKYNATLHEVHSNDPCCKNYTCVCSPAENKKCLHPGEIVNNVQSSEEYCNPEQQCNCSTDMNLLRNECKQFKEATANCTQEDRHVEQTKEAGHDINDPCCPAYECTCNKCPTDRPICSEGYQLKDQRSEGDCCSNWTCVCDVCFDKDNLPIARGNSVNVTDSNGCISTFICSSTEISNNDDSCFELKEMMKPPCETKTAFEERECNTPLQYAVPVTYKDGQIDPNLCCEEYQCVCNSSVNIEELEVCEEVAYCLSDGCYPHHTELCGCATSSHCVCDSHHCRSAPTCEKCHNLMTQAAANVGTSDERCASNTCCPSYSCAPVPCNNTEPVICGPKEVKTKVPDGECCEKEVCICELCVDEQNNKHKIGDDWPDYSDPNCATKVCTRDENKSHECPVIGILGNKRQTCRRANEVTCGTHERKVQYAVDECCFDWNCTCDPKLCRTTPETCEAGHELVVNHEASDYCCNVTKCCETTCVVDGYPYQAGEEWTDGCERMRCDCDGDGCCKVEQNPRCPEQVVPTCVNNEKPVAVSNPKDPCCPEYQCRCECDVFGDPHYVTFDDSYYTYMGKCRNSLVAFRNSSRLHIYSDNTVCNPDTEVTCLKRIFVKWDDSLVEFYYNESRPLAESVSVNNVILQKLPWSQSGIEIKLVNYRIVLTIPEIELEVRYSKFSLPCTTIVISMSKMFNETVGLCGTCSNNPKDDYEGRNGTFFTYSTDFGASWRMNGTDEECECDPDKEPRCSCWNDRETSENCTCQSDNCDILKSDVFKDCHTYLNPDNFISACRQDGPIGECGGCNSTSFPVYAEKCETYGVCIDWMSALNCTAPTCSDGFEHKSCARACDVERTCDNYMDTPTCTDDRLISGCFCKPGLVRLTTGSNECIEPSCCSCPKDPTCPPNQIPQDVPGEEASCCPNKICVCTHEVDPDYCKPPFVLKFTNNSCPICICPECSFVPPDCTQSFGCRLNVSKQDACGCPESGICECNPDLCPAKPECGNCAVAVAIERNTTSEMDECTNCCTPWKCRPVTCTPDYNTLLIPEGYKKKQDNDKCCPTIYCASCRLSNGSHKWLGDVWSETENGCRVTKMCRNKEDSSDSCHKSIVIDDGTSNCVTKDVFEQFNCEKNTEVAVESDNNGSCCPNYTCTCNPEPPIVSCSYDQQEKVKVHPKDKSCQIEECVCKNNSEHTCLNYLSVYDECQAYPNKEVVKTNEKTFYGPCCPRFRCDCKNCSELVDNTTCSRGFTQETKFDGCCNRKVCKCNSCMNEKGEHFEVGVTWWEFDKSGCNTSYSCEKTNSFTNEGCYTPTARPRICNVPECPTCTTLTEIQYNASYPDPDLCCPEYDCSYNPCPSSYKPPPTNVPDHYHVEKNMSNPCCPTWSLICDVCQRSDGSIMKRGSSINGTYEDGCPVTYTCTDQRIGNNATSCFVIDEFSNRQTCLHKDVFESSCNTTYQHAVEVDYINGESDPNPCCTEYTCSCKNSDTLATICSTTKFNYEICKQPGRKNFTFTAVPSTYDCCTEPSCPCVNELELENHCPPVPSCEYGKEPIKYMIEGECCPKYNCTCSSCPTDYQPYPNATLAPYEKYEVIKSAGWKCCPTYKIVCNDTSQCPVRTCAANHTLMKLPDQLEPDTNGCCPKYVCRCDVCELHDGSFKQVGETWKEQTEGGCFLTLNCTKHRVSSSSSDLESCHEEVVTSDPRDWCQTKTQFESKFCNNYTEAVLNTDDNDLDPCCDDYICTCKSEDQLKTVCPNDMNESCSVYMEKTEVGTISGTKDCCPEFACTCQSDDVLSKECQQWDDYECPLGNQRYMIRERNNATGPCCPKYDCSCLSDKMLEQVCEHWNFSCPYGQKRVKTNDDCCPTYECVCDKCVYEKGIYPVNTTFPIKADHCWQGVCVLNVTSNCPEPVIQEKYKCPFVNETDCDLRGGKLLDNESVQGCCKYCCSCPEDPQCPPNKILQVVPGDEKPCCPNKTCVCTHKVDPAYCRPPFVLELSSNSCPNCTCPEKCSLSSSLPNCTQKLGCRLNVTKQDECGCPEKGICECNPNLCPAKPECDDCSVAVAVTVKRNTTSEMDECTNCCTPWECRPVTCTPDYNTLLIPEGYKKKQDNDKCCPTIYCASCRLSNGSHKWLGDVWSETENGCRVTKMCRNKEDSSDSCHKSIVIDDGTSNCVTKDVFEQFNCEKNTEVAVESDNNGSCCPNYTCTCNPEPPIVSCSYDQQEKVKVHPKDKSCQIEECVCKNNSEHTCLNYLSVYDECQAYPNKEVVKTNEKTFYGPCCPRFRCDCKNCSELVDNTTCSRGFTQETKFDGCCNRKVCKCNSCMNEKGEHFEVGVTWWEFDKSGCNTSYSCEKTNSFTNEGCYTPTARPRICNVPECPTCTTLTEIQYNASYPDPDLCCPEYDCSYNPCPSSYKPPPTNVPDHYHVEKNMSNPCCPTWSLICDVCQRSDGSIMKRGSSINGTYEDGCPVTYTCTDQRIGNNATSCFVIDEFSNRQTCLHKDVFESSCNTTYQHAVEVDYINGESDPNPCCTEYTCSCKNSDTLATICSTTKFNYEICKQPGRKNFTFTAVPSTYDCCTEPSCPCVNELELENHCPPVPSCEYGKEPIKYMIEGECCPKYNCTCSSCPTDYQPYPNATLAPYEKYEVIKSAGWKCCPTYKIVCNDTSQCPVRTCAANHTLMKLPDQLEPDTNGCCPKYVCRCDVCELHDGSFKQVGETWKEQTEGGCFLTLNCTKHRVSSSSSDLESCHEEVVTSDPRDWCQTKTQFESKFCNNYTEAVLNTDDNDLDPCCDDYICTCKSEDQLKTVCPNDMNESCSVYMEKTEVGTISGTKDCCPEFACTCQSDDVLSKECQQWDDYECPLGNQRYMIRERNNATGPCCPKYDCSCLSDKMLEQVCEHWNFSCPYGQKRVKTNDDCCPTYECVCDKCVYEKGIYPVNTTFPIKADHCWQGVCVLNVTSNCPEPVIQEKYKCPFVNETDCDLRGGKLLDNESVQGCCKYCCSCPEDPQCPPNKILQVVPGDEKPCCPNKTCVCTHKVDPAYCRPPFVLELSSNSCPNCTCPEKCSLSSSLPNCTQKLGCRLNVTKQDECGCPEKGICECNPNLCPAKPECDDCSVAVAVTVKRNTTSEMDECTNCCTPWECRPVTCTPDYNTLLIPEGYKKKQDNDKCCPTIYCASCRLSNGSHKWLGDVWSETENGCRVTKMCRNKEDSSDSCHKSIVIDDGTSNCVTKDVFEQFNCEKNTEVAVESDNNGSCCPNYTCTCNPEPPIVSCSYDQQEKVKVHPKDKSCQIEECVCKNNSEHTCLNYLSVYDECQAYPNKEVVKTNEKTFYGPCCPRFRCDCKNCSELVDNTTCSRGFTQETKFDGCCNRKVCKCNSCMNEKGEHFEVGVTWWEFDKSGCNTSYSCEKTNSFTNEGCYTPTARPRICNVPECPTCTTLTEIQYNASYPDPDLCCPEYDCSYNPCPSSYKPPPTNVPDHYHVEKNMSNPCCPTWSLICDVCQRSDGSIMKRGSSINGTYEDGCPVTYTCTDQRIGNNATSCFVIDEFSNRQTCLHKDVFESSCNTTYQHAVEVDYINGESDPNPCCTEYTCSCKNSDTLATICSTTKFNYEICKQPGRKNFTFTAVPSTYDCCTEPSCPCVNELELENHCPPVPSCEYGKEPIKYMIEGECCPKYNCTCSSCPTDYQPYPNATLAPYEKYEVIKSAGWKCCPTYKIVCNDTSQCPVRTCAANHTLMKLPDQLEPDTNGCCPKYVCRCDVCELHDGSFKQVGETWKEQTEGGCFLTLNCTKHRVSSSSSDLESCHEEVVTSDPRDWCQTKTQFESKFCNNYTEAVLNTDDNDLDPCCDDYICTCKSEDQLKTVCPNDMNESCSVYMEKTEVGTISGTKDCCPEFACTCQSDDVLSKECQQWDDYECPLGNQRYMIRERNNATGPCCPKYDCSCLSDKMLEQVCEHWNFSCPYGQKRVKTNDDCCPTYECVCDKCVYEKGIYPVNTTFPIKADHCWQGVCVLNVTSNCPEPVIQEKYKCPFVNETDCDLRGGKLLNNESVQGCCKYCCSCPEDPQCPPNKILQVVPGDEKPCCPNKTCVCTHKVDPAYCRPPFVLELSSNSCPNCTCPEKCSLSSSLPNCTQKLGCRLNVTKQDECGCPEKGICECNPNLCPAKPECDDCSVAVAVTVKRNTTSEMDECTNCCTPWECRPVTCTPDYNTLLIPEGYKKKQDNDKCCPTIYCASCRLSNGSHKWLGDVWSETENGCRVTKMCRNKEDSSDSCHKSIVIDDGTSNCVTKDVFEQFNCEKNTEVAVESDNNGSCCPNYTCTCNPEPPIVSCSYDQQEKVKVHPKDKSCQIEECVCKNNSEHTCLNYLSVYDECQAYPNKEVVKTNEKTFYGPCCPRFRCDCKNCSELVDNTTCSRGFTQETKFDGCCNRKVCKCNSCMNEKGEHFEVGVTWWEFDKSGCNTSYSCEKTNSFTNEGCYTPTARPRICNVPECPTCTTLTEIQYNASYPDPDLCCPEYDCSYNPCPSSYKPPPTNVPDHYHVEKNMSNPCCPTWYFVCDVCQRSDGSIMKRGSSINGTYEDGCPVTYTCTDQRIGNKATSCFVIDEFSNRQTCLHKDVFESKSCNTTYQHAVEVVYINGEWDPNPCCAEYTCSCKNSTALATICPTTKFNYEICKQPGRKNFTFTKIPSTYDCCTEPSCPCFNELELENHCPVPSCEYGKEPIKYTIEGECCPKYNCTCSSCPTDYQPYPNATLAPYEKYEVIKSAGWKCCPTYEIVCNDTSQCPVPTCSINYWLMKLPDQLEPDTNGCCPKYVCRCDVCELQDGSFKQVGESWNEQVDGGCSLTLRCTMQRVSYSSLDLESCHEALVTSDPRDWCQTKTQFESKFCNNYTEAVLNTDDKDSDPCCDDYNCTCKSKDQLKTVCPNDMNESCSVYMEKTKVGTISGTSDCCPEYACTCQSDEVLSIECQQWDDYECPLGNKRNLIRERNNGTGPCCPEYGCTCLPDEMLEQVCEHWNFSCPYGQKRVKTNDDCCPTYECVCDKCVYEKGIYPVNTTFPIEADHCWQGVCVLNVTSNCPEPVIQEKYKCPFVNETDCVLRGGRLVANETVQSCCKYCEPTPAPCKRETDRLTLNATIDTHRCWTKSKVDVNFCTGSCPTIHGINAETGKMEGLCQCCKSLMYSNQTHSMICDDGFQRQYTQKVIFGCGCQETSCEARNATPFVSSNP